MDYSLKFILLTVLIQFSPPVGPEEKAVKDPPSSMDWETRREHIKLSLSFSNVALMWFNTDLYLRRKNLTCSKVIQFFPSVGGKQVVCHSLPSALEEMSWIIKKTRVSGRRGLRYCNIESCPDFSFLREASFLGSLYCLEHVILSGTMTWKGNKLYMNKCWMEG